MAENENPMVQNRSMLKDFVASIATMSGDLSNITAPPFVLDTKSVIEIPSFWAENPSIFVSPTTSDDPVQRALLVVRSFLSGLRSQCYMGHDPKAGVKKPINAFLGELFVGKWEDENGTTEMLGEQVSHHPPITACRVWNDEHGVIAEGYNRQTITFSGSVYVQCSGHILKTLTKYNEHYLMPIPDFKIKGILGTPYPETTGTYYIPSTTGYFSVIHFSGKSMFSSSSKKHTFTAHLYKESEGESHPLYTIEGQWDTKFTIHDHKKNKDVEVFDVEAQALEKVPPLITKPLDKQDPWESRNAWRDTIAALKSGNMQAVSDSKNRLEQGQRQMREDEEKRGEKWQTLFFKKTNDHEVVARLTEAIPNESFKKLKEETEGVWAFDIEAWKKTKRPYHGSLRPDNTTVDQNGTAERESRQTQETEPVSQQHQPQSRVDPSSERIGHDNDMTRAGKLVEVNGTVAQSRDKTAARAAENVPVKQPEPQPAHNTTVNETLSRGVENMGIDEKKQIENMLRDQYSTASSTRKTSHAARKSVSRT